MYLRFNYKKFLIFTYGLSTITRKFHFMKEEENIKQDFRFPKLPRYRASDKKQSIKSNIKEFRSAYLFEDLSDLVNYDPKATKSKDQIIHLGDSETIPKHSFMQVNINSLSDSPYTNKFKVFNSNDQPEVDLEEEDPKRYFNKVLVFHTQDSYYATSSFCGYDLTDLKDGVFLGNKIVCPTCMSEYNIERGNPEHGPNMKYLASFPISLKENKLILKVPEDQLPLFSLHKDMDTLDLDPRHFVLIGDTETTVSALDSLKKVFSGKISLINHQTGLDFIDFNKLSKSFFPTKAKHSRWISNDYLEKNKIQLYNDKVVKIDAIDKVITLASGIKMPFDKTLIAVGSEIENIFNRYSNSYSLNTVIDHANIHNNLIKKENNNIAVVGNNIRAIEICCSIRRYLDIIGKQNARVSLVVPNEWYIEKYGDEDCCRIMENYLLRNRIVVFRNIKLGIKASKDENKVESLVFRVKSTDYQIPVNTVIFEMGLKMESRCDFLNSISIESEEGETFSVISKNVITPDARLSLHSSSRYPFVFTAGSCCAVVSQYFKNNIIRSDNVNANFHFGYIAALNMLDFNYPFDDIIVDSGKVLDKWVHLIGNDEIKTKYVYKNYEKNQFVSYLCNRDSVQGMLVFGFKNLHIFFKEALKLELVPNEKFVTNNLNDLHLHIINSVLKNTDNISCYKHLSFNETTHTNSGKYSIPDQIYTTNLMKRSVSAYKFYRDRLNKESEKYNKEFDEKKRKESEEIKNQRQTEDGEGEAESLGEKIRDYEDNK